MHIKKWLFFVLLAIVFLVGCNIKGGSILVIPEKELEIKTLGHIELSDREILLYNIFGERIGIYNLDDYSFHYLNNEDNVYQYIFEENQDLFTTGHSINNDFEICHVVNNAIEILYTLEDAKSSCIFPLNIVDEKQYYLFYENERTENETRSIVTLENNEIVYLLSSHSLVSDAIVMEESIYYTIYLEKEDIFELHYYDLLSQRDELLKTGLISGSLYKYKNEIMTDDRDNISSGNITYKLGDYNYFDEVNNLLFQVIVDNDQGLFFRVTDLITNEILYEVLEPITYKIENDKIVVYTKKGIESISFAESLR